MKTYPQSSISRSAEAPAAAVPNLKWRQQEQQTPKRFPSDPKQEFKREAFNMFEVLLSNIKNEIAKVVMLVEVKTEEQTKKLDQKNQQEVDKASVDSQNQDNQTNQQRKIGRNESCPCGSGKKYKHCHGVLS